MLPPAFFRVGWIAYGAALNEGRALFPGDAEFGRWVRISNLDKRDGSGIHPGEQQAAMWAAANPEQFAEARAAGNADRIKRKICRLLAPARTRDHRVRQEANLPFATSRPRIADEYDAAQDRGEVRPANQGRSASALEAPSAGDIGLSHKAIHEALHPETKAHVAGAHASNKAQGNASANLAVAFTADTAAKTGQSERAVQRDAERGSTLPKPHTRAAAVLGNELDAGRFERGADRGNGVGGNCGPFRPIHRWSGYAGGSRQFRLRPMD